MASDVSKGSNVRLGNYRVDSVMGAAIVPMLLLTQRKKVNIMEFLGMKQARKTIGLIAANGRKLDERIHTVGCSALYHFQDCEDTTLLTELVKAMPKSSRGNALKYWITQHANVKWSKKAFGGEGGFVKDGKEVQVDLDHAVEHPFYEKKDTEQVQFNPETRVKSFIKAFQKAIEKGDITREDFESYKQQILEA